MRRRPSESSTPLSSGTSVAITSSSLSLLEGLTESERDEFVAAATPQQLKAHDILAQQGAPAMAFYVVEVGYLRVSQSDDNGREISGRTIGPGHGFGGAVAMGRPRYTTSARALQPARVLRWQRPMLRALLDKYPQVRGQIMRDETRPADQRERQQEAAAAGLSSRLARILIALSAHGSRSTGASIDIVHPLTRQDMADLLGVPAVDVSVPLAGLEKAGLISTTRSHVRILNLPDLETAAGAE
jgi:CRP/FNR family transcriptional regulator, nitrogen oxide reductase regulator